MFSKLWAFHYNSSLTSIKDSSPIELALSKSPLYSYIELRKFTKIRRTAVIMYMRANIWKGITE